VPVGGVGVHADRRAGRAGIKLGKVGADEIGERRDVGRSDGTVKLVGGCVFASVMQRQFDGSAVKSRESEPARVGALADEHREPNGRVVGRVTRREPGQYFALHGELWAKLG